VEHNPIRIAEILLGLKDVNVIGVEDLGNEEVPLPLRVHIECRGERPQCPLCNGMRYSKGTSLVELYDLQSFGRAVRLIWHKRPRSQYQCVRDLKNKSMRARRQRC